MPKYWGKQIFADGRFPEVGKKQKTEREKKTNKKEKRRPNDGDNNGQATHGARKHAWRTHAAWAKILGTSSYYNWQKCFYYCVTIYSARPPYSVK